LVGNIVRAGQLQAHSLTGALPQGFSSKVKALESLGGGTTSIRRNLAKATERMQQATGPERQKLRLQVESLAQGLAAEEKTVGMGMNSAPGMFKALATRPGEALRAAGEYQWKSSPTVTGRAMTVGVPAAFVGSEALRDSKPGEDSRGLRTVGSVASTLPFSLGRMPLMGAMAASALAGGAVRTLGRPFQRRKPDLGQQPGPPVPEDGGVSEGVEREFSDRSLGRMPEGQL
jgi:hypothetical protein